MAEEWIKRFIAGIFQASLHRLPWPVLKGGIEQSTIPKSVDLQGKKVSGHVPENLQYLEVVENLRKNNIFEVG